MGTYSIIYLKKPEKAIEVNNLLKEQYNLKYETYNGIDYGLFFSQEMFNEDLRFMNEDEEGITNLPHFKRPISKETYYSLLFGLGNCFGDIGTVCIKISSISDKDIDTIAALQKFSKTPKFKKLINFRKSKNLQRLLQTKM
ncbi:hypothetical protein B0A69_02975 [Chryseobacterium shigense]|uniref:Uncharacterized protein n=1 Tax=Chryseobacterium shigense TaxID=297244 RepID=A0A1N7I834_9FLAO|nr:hypothetical protein [Chryseobacterium shigense]PQA97027.1 hypothetical protein B0A69_02975 [Chryseobacterium shigense]SIS33170.1 hypothetical protein SAMN05421639_102536 [Chryseobacterium shigense]